MAKQNFLAGGYYGKLGVTVGQRWKNKRTIRSYVIPKNPRTPAQQANRGSFGSVVPWAQLGMSMNYKSPCVQSESMTEWNVRMSIARELVKNGEEGLNLIPLYPINYSIPYQITKMQIKSLVQGDPALFDIEGNLPDTPRKFSIVFDIYDTSDVFIKRVLYPAETRAGNLNVLVVDTDDNSEINNHCFCRIVSNDDTENALGLVASVALPVEAPSIIPMPFDSSVRSVSRSDRTYTLTFNNEYGSAVHAYNNVSIHCVVNGSWVTKTIGSGNLINNDGMCAIRWTETTSFENELPAFPSGAYVSAGELVTQTATTRYSAENTQDNFTSTDLTREIEQITQYGYGSGYSLIAILPLPYSGSFVAQGNAQVKTNRWWGNAALETMACSWGSASGNLGLFFSNGNTESVMMNNCYANIPRCEITLEGVTYVLIAQRLDNIVNGCTVQEYRANTNYDNPDFWTDEENTMQVDFLNVEAPSNVSEGDSIPDFNDACNINYTYQQYWDLADVAYEAYENEALRIIFTLEDEFSSYGASYLSSPRYPETAEKKVLEFSIPNVPWTFRIRLGSIPFNRFVS